MNLKTRVNKLEAKASPEITDMDRHDILNDIS